MGWPDVSDVAESAMAAVERLHLPSWAVLVWMHGKNRPTGVSRQRLGRAMALFVNKETDDCIPYGELLEQVRSAWSKGTRSMVSLDAAKLRR